MRMGLTTHNTFPFFSAIWCLVSETLALETLLEQMCCSKFFDLKHYFMPTLFMPVLWHTNPPKMSAPAGFALSHLILMKGIDLYLIFWISYVQPCRHG